MISRILALVAGVLILSALAHVAVIATGGYGTPHSYLTLAIAFGVAIASICSGASWSAGRNMLAVWLVIAIIAGEGYNIIATAERLVSGREATQAPLREANDEHARAAKRVEDAKTAVDHAPTTSERLRRAQAAKAEADAAVIEKSAERGCRDNCRQLLQARVDAAADELKHAQTALDVVRDKATDELREARAALAALKAPQSPTPLADRIGVKAGIIDLLTSALGSIAANGLAAGLLIFGAHHRARRVEVIAPLPVSPINDRVDIPVIDNAAPRRSATGEPGKGLNAIVQHAAKFAVECLKPGGEADLQAIRDEYGVWCPKNCRHSEAQFGRALAKLLNQAGITIADRNGRLVAIGVSLKQRDRRELLPVETA